MDAATKRLVRQRAADRCEYCQLAEIHSALRFHIEHIVAEQHGGKDTLDNLALACPECNFRKGTNLTGIDPDSGQITRLFHPRRDQWNEHFSDVHGAIVGKTITGRTTSWLPGMNTDDRVRLRLLLRKLK
jgi:hypothetical protein